MSQPPPWSRFLAISIALAAVLVGCMTSSSSPEDLRPEPQSRPVRVMKRRDPHEVRVESAPPGAHLTYYGGRVVSNMQVVQVLYGNGNYLPQVQGTASPNMLTFYQGVLNSPYVDWLTEYNTNTQTGTRSNQTIGRGSFLRQVTITPSAQNNGTTIDDTNIQAELTAQIQAGILPAPTTDAAGNNNTYYAVFFPHGKVITMGGSASCVQFCAYHGTIANAGGHEIYYGIHPDMQVGSGCETGCGADPTPFNNYTSVASHEMTETITDAEVGIAPATGFGPPLAWYDQTNGEIGDICNGQQGTVVGGDGVTYTVQLEFSNTANNCIVSRPVANDFSISASPSSLAFVQGQGGSGTSTISTAVVSGSAGAVSLTVSVSPAGPTASLSASSVTAGQSATLTVNAGNAAAGSYTVTVTGTEGSATHSTSVAVTITNPQTNDFSISASPSSLTLNQGASGSSTISTAVVSGSPGTVSLAVSGVPSGATATLSQTSVPAGQSSTLTIAAGSAAAGSYTITVTGSEGAATHSTSVALTITGTTSGGIVNGGFETGAFSGWTTSGASETVVSTGCHGGTYCARLGSTSPTNGDSTIKQTFTAPSGTTNLSLWYKETCPDTITYDWALATLHDNTAGTTANVVSKRCATTGWTSASVSVTAGHSYTLTLTSHDDNYPGDATYTLFDDVSLTTSAPPPSGITNGGFETGTFSGWTTSGSSDTITSSGAHGGTYAAVLGSTSPTSGDSTVAQSFTVPSGKTQLSLWYANNCPDTVTYDWITITLADNTAGTTVTLVAPTCAASFVWTNKTASVIAGHSYTLTVTNHDDNYPGDPTYSLLDDVTLN